MKIAYRIFVVLTLLLAAAYFLLNPEKIQGYVPTLILFLAVSVSVLFIKEVKFSLLFITLPAAILFTAYFQRNHVFPELLILSLNRSMLSVLSLLPLKRIRIHPLLKLVYFNAVIFIALIELVLAAVSAIHPFEILKRKTDVFRLAPNTMFNNAMVNSEGYMGREAGEKKRERRLLFIGDSFGVGVVDYAGNFIQMIDDSTDYECVNLSQPGYSPIDYLRELKDNLKRSDSDGAVIILFAGNDIINISLPENNWSAENWKIVNLARNVRAVIKGGKSSEGGAIDLRRDDFLEVEAARTGVLFPGNLKKEWSLFEKTVTEIISFMNKNGKDCAFVIIPDEYSVDEKLRGELSLNENPDWDYAVKRMKEILIKNKADVWDMTDALKESCLKGERVYRENDTYINEAGNRVVFEEIRKHLDIEKK